METYKSNVFSIQVVHQQPCWYGTWRRLRSELKHTSDCVWPMCLGVRASRSSSCRTFIFLTEERWLWDGIWLPTWTLHLTTRGRQCEIRLWSIGTQFYAVFYKIKQPKYAHLWALMFMKQFNDVWILTGSPDVQLADVLLLIMLPLLTAPLQG